MDLTGRELQHVFYLLAKEIYEFEDDYKLDSAMLETAIALTADEKVPTAVGLLCESYMQVVAERVEDAKFWAVINSAYDQN